MTDVMDNSDIPTALTAMKAAVEAAEAAIDKMNAADESVWADEDTFTTTSSQLTRVKNALDQASDIVNGNQPSATTDAFGAQANEDTELVASALSIVQTELQRAQAHLAEWVSIGDMRIKEVNASLAEAQGYGAEIQARLADDQAKYNWYVQQYQMIDGQYKEEIQILQGSV